MGRKTRRGRLNSSSLGEQLERLCLENLEFLKPGETVFTTIPATVASTGGAAITNKQVYQFTTAAGGTGPGDFADSTSPQAGR